MADLMPNTLVLFSDDSSEAQYQDGARIRLSPCGSEFVYERADIAAHHPLQRQGRRRHRTEYVTSCYRDRVLQLLEFRNAFSSRPFLPSSVVPPEKKTSLLTEISEVTWPSLEDAKGCVTSLENGSVKISSVDGNAHLYMPPLQDGFTVEFLCQLSSANSMPVSESLCKNIEFQNGHRLKFRDGSRSLETAENKVTCNDIIRSKYTSYPTQIKDETLSFTRHAFQYTWQAQCFSVFSYPDAFKYPMALALLYHQKRTEHDEKSDLPIDIDITVESFLKEHENGAISVLPKALPLTCQSTHLHSWQFSELTLEIQDKSTLYPVPIKVVKHNNIIYRFIFDESNTMEIRPGDGSLFLSEGLNLGKYFKYSIFNKDTAQKEERIYAIRELPPDKPRTLYSVRSLISQAVRYLEICCASKLSLNPLFDTCCWEMESNINTASSAVPVLLEQSDIPGIGRFAAYANNVVLAAYLDGVILHMIWSFCFQRCPQDQNQEIPLLPKCQAVPKHDRFSWCRLHFPNGTTKLVQLEYPGDYVRYITAAKEWCRWLDEKNQRATVMPAAEENWSVTAELQKIQRFQFLLENSRSASHRRDIKLSPQPDLGGKSLCGEMNIHSVLQKTSKAIQDIELLLSSRKQ